MREFKCKDCGSIVYVNLREIEIVRNGMETCPDCGVIHECSVVKATCPNCGYIMEEPNKYQ